jgi:hypothetical protein
VEIWRAIERFEDGRIYGHFSSSNPTVRFAA